MYKIQWLHCFLFEWSLLIYDLVFQYRYFEENLETDNRLFDQFLY